MRLTHFTLYKIISALLQSLYIIYDILYINERWLLIMKKFTMVMRSGDPKGKAEEMYYTLIDQNYSFMTASGIEIMNGISAGKFEVTNLDVVGGRLKASNGAMDRYNLIDQNGVMQNKEYSVILDRVESNGELVGYTLFPVNGGLAEVTVEAAVAMHNNGGIANSKIRHTSKGDILQPINGSYNLRVINMKDKADGKIDIKVLFFGSSIGKGKAITKYTGVIINTDSAVEFGPMLNKLKDLNGKVVKNVLELGAEKEVVKSLPVTITGEAGVYVVIPTDSLLKIAKSPRAKIDLVSKSTMVACRDYSETSEGEETTLVLTKDFKVLREIKGTDRSYTEVKKYLSELKNGLKEVGLDI